MSTRRTSTLAMLFVSAIFAFVVLAAGCSQAAPAPASPPSQPAPASAPAQPASKPAEVKTSVLKVNVVSAAEAPQTLAIKAMVEDIRQKSNGTFDVQLYVASELGSNADNVEQATRGSNIMTFADPGYVGSWAPDFMAMTLPYTYRAWQDVGKVVDSPWYAGQLEIAASHGLKMFPQNWVVGKRHFLSDKVITTPADVKGMKVRVPPNKVQLELINALGGVPVTTAWGEVFTALNQGVVDAVEADLPNIYASKLHEAKKKIALTGHLMLLNGPIMSQQYFDSLPKEHQQLLEEATKRHGDKFAQAMDQEEQTRWRKSLEEAGVVINEVDMDAFAKAAEAVATKFDWAPGTVDGIRAALK